MFDSRTARWRGYLWAVLVIVVATGALDLLRDVLSTSTVTLLYLLAICLVAALWGLVPSLLAAFSAFLALNYFFVQPLYTFGVHHPQDVLVLAVFLIAAGDYDDSAHTDYPDAPSVLTRYFEPVNEPHIGGKPNETA
jgi:two-component system sensor histidine kinase KdpD